MYIQMFRQRAMTVSGFVSNLSASVSGESYLTEARMELHLLVSTNNSAGGRILAVQGQQWHLLGPYRTDDPNPVPSYACVSYVWGSNRVENPVFPDHHMSDQTIPALRAAIGAASSDVSAFWIDAFCVPYHQPARSATLESMGYIYSAADRVVAALGPEYCAGLWELENDSLSEDLLTTFESSAWIASVWTYQEFVNAQEQFITSMADDAPTIDGIDFISRIGSSLHQYKKTKGYTSSDIRRLWPRLDAFEDLGGDYRLYGAFQRPVLQIMSMLDRRVAHDERNKYYSMMGALTAKITEKKGSGGYDLKDLRKKFLDLCEEKGDWSFLYSSTARDYAQPWMPNAEFELKSILPHFVHGTGQSGRRDKGGSVWLENVSVRRNVFKTECKPDVAAIMQAVLSASPFAANDTTISLGELKELTRKVLTSANFTGHGKEIVMSDGIFHPQDHVPVQEEVDLVLCTESRWSLWGRPGLVVVRDDNGVKVIPGAFVGTISRDFEIGEYLLDSGAHADSHKNVESL